MEPVEFNSLRPDNRMSNLYTTEVNDNFLPRG